MKMNPEVKALWVEDLRSGKHKQGGGALRKAGAFCCLGRLTDLFINHPANTCDVKWTKSEFNDGIVASYTSEGERSFLSSHIIKWSGLDRKSGAIVEIPPTLAMRFGLEQGQCDLVILNDAGVPFLEIADIIEEQL